MKYDLIISGTIGSWGCSADYVQYVLNNHKDTDVHVAICSLGGFVDDGLRIYQQFIDHGKVHCHFIGMSASAATFIAMGAVSVDMAKNSLILIHNASGYLDEWGRYNKEQLDSLIEQLKFQRNQLSTIDDVIAQIYADKSGKPVDDVKRKMKVAAWIKPADAVDFGLVDSVVESVSTADKQPKNKLFNSLFTDSGFPPLPKDFNIETGEETPTTGIIQKAVEMLSNLLPKQPADNNQFKMITAFTTVQKHLKKDGFNVDKDNRVSLSQGELKAIDDMLDSQEKACTEAAATIKNLKAEVNRLTVERDNLSEQVKTLKGAPGDIADIPDTDEPADSLTGAKELFELIQNAM